MSQRLVVFSTFTWGVYAMVPRRRAASRPARTAAIASSGRRALVGPAHGQGGVPPGATVGFRSERENSPPAASAPARTIAIASSGMRALVGPAHTALARKGRNSLASVAGAPAPARTGAVPDGRRTARAGFLLERLSAFGAKGGTPRPQPACRPVNRRRLARARFAGTPAQEIAQAACISRSISSGSVGTPSLSTSGSPLVAATSSSIRMPMPCHSLDTPLVPCGM